MLLYIYKNQDGTHLHTENLSGKSAEHGLLPPIGSFIKHTLFEGRIKDIYFDKESLDKHDWLKNIDTVLAYVTVDTQAKGKK